MLIKREKRERRRIEQVHLYMPSEWGVLIRNWKDLDRRPWWHKRSLASLVATNGLCWYFAYPSWFLPYFKEKLEKHTARLGTFELRLTCHHSWPKSTCIIVPKQWSSLVNNHIHIHKLLHFIGHSYFWLIKKPTQPQTTGKVTSIETIRTLSSSSLSTSFCDHLKSLVAVLLSPLSNGSKSSRWNAAIGSSTRHIVHPYPCLCSHFQGFMTFQAMPSVKNKSLYIATTWSLASSLSGMTSALHKLVYVFIFVFFHVMFWLMGYNISNTNKQSGGWYLDVC